MFKHPTCGGKHNTVAEARQCDSGRQAPATITTPARSYAGTTSAVLDRLRTQRTWPEARRSMSRPSVAWSDGLATDKQMSYLRDLVAKKETTQCSYRVRKHTLEVLADGRTPRFEDASEAIAELKSLPYREAEVAPTTTPAPVQATRSNVKALKALVPDGRYAVNVPDFGQDKLQFFFVRINRRGYVRVDQVVSDSRMPVSFGRYANVLQAIIEAGTAEAGKAFADHYGQCFKCGRALTDEDNPYKRHGLGPDCGPKVMG